MRSQDYLNSPLEAPRARVPVFQKGIPLFPEGVAVFKHRHALALFREGVRAAAAENASLLSQEGAAAPEFFFQKVAQCAIAFSSLPSSHHGGRADRA